MRTRLGWACRLFRRGGVGWATGRTSSSTPDKGLLLEWVEIARTERARGRGIPTCHRSCVDLERARLLGRRDIGVGAESRDSEIDVESRDSENDELGGGCAGEAGRGIARGCVELGNTIELRRRVRDGPPIFNTRPSFSFSAPSISTHPTRELPARASISLRTPRPLCSDGVCVD